MLQRKNQDRHEEQRRDQLQNPLAEEIQHESARFPGEARRATTRGARYPRQQNMAVTVLT
jgi:hypothetical protein